MAKAESYGAVLLLRFHEHAEEPEEQLQIVFRLARENGVMVKFRGSWPTLRCRTLEYHGQSPKADANFKEESQWLALLRVLHKKIAKIRLTTPCLPEDQNVGNVVAVQVDAVRRAVSVFDYSPLFRESSGNLEQQALGAGEGRWRYPAWVALTGVSRIPSSSEVFLPVGQKG